MREMYQNVMKKKNHRLTSISNNSKINVGQIGLQHIIRAREDELSD